MVVDGFRDGTDLDVRVLRGGVYLASSGGGGSEDKTEGVNKRCLDAQAVRDGTAPVRIMGKLMKVQVRDSVASWRHMRHSLAQADGHVTSCLDVSLRHVDSPGFHASDLDLQLHVHIGPRSAVCTFATHLQTISPTLACNHTMAFVPLPPDFLDLVNAIGKTQTNSQALYNVIGVCVDFLDPTKSRGTDYTVKFTLQDPLWPKGQGMTFRFFNSNEKHLPAIQNQGDIVILRNVKTLNIRGELLGVSTFSTSWVVLPHSELDNINSRHDVETKARWLDRQDGKGPRRTQPLNDAELKYAKWISEREDPSQWVRLTGSTRLQLENVMRSSGGQPLASEDKFRLVKDLRQPAGKPYYFAELLGEVRKMFSSDRCTELYVTDYTSHDSLWNYTCESKEEGYDGDRFGHINDPPKMWPGPWGKLTMVVTLWDCHADYAKRNVIEGKYVYLRNVQIKTDKNGTRLEGACRGDRFNPTRSNVEVRQPREADDRMKALLSRKRDYERRAKSEHMQSSTNAQELKQKRTRKEDELEDRPKGKKSKKGKDRSRNRPKKGKTTMDGGQPIRPVRVNPDKPTVRANVNVRCNRIEVPCKAIVDILDPDILARETPQGNVFRLPFQNCKYKTNVRVVDFFPDNIADFAAPRKVSDYDVLADHDGADEDSDIDLAEGPRDDVRWEWCFYLLVEDAQPLSCSTERPRQMELLVADTDGDFLLQMDACNLRDKANVKSLAKMKEKLFHLWGDLQEKKEECTTAEGITVKPNGRPFECLIKEYGVRRPDCDGSPEDAPLYDRIFRLFNTTI